jgi:hypothetical protein
MFTDDERLPTNVWTCEVLREFAKAMQCCCYSHFSLNPEERNERIARQSASGMEGIYSLMSMCIVALCDKALDFTNIASPDGANA